MSCISQVNFQRIAESALSVLYDSYPLPLTTRAVAREIARDNEFTGKVLAFLEGQHLVQRVGKGYVRWVKWCLTPAAQKRYESLGKGTS
ncbi:MAG: hypothetical protein WC607_00455 [Candidatus Micrarchaeia archaeon]